MLFRSAAWYDTIVSSGLTGDLIWYVWLPSRCQQRWRMLTCSSPGRRDHISRSGAPRTTDMRCVCYDSQLWASCLSLVQRSIRTMLYILSTLSMQPLSRQGIYEMLGVVAGHTMTRRTLKERAQRAGSDDVYQEVTPCISYGVTSNKPAL